MGKALGYLIGAAITLAALVALHGAEAALASDEEAPPAPAAPRAPRPYWRVLPSGWFGVAMDCSRCGGRWDEGRAEAEWEFEGEPRVYSVERGSPAARAGLRKGDVITHVDGVRITSAKGGRLFGATKPDQTVKWTVRRGGQSRVFTMTAEENPKSSRQARARLRAVREFEREVSELRALQERMTEQRVRKELATKHRARASEERALEIEARIDQLKEVERMRTSDLVELEDKMQALSERMEALQAETPSRAPRVPKTLRYSGRLAGVNVIVRSEHPVVVSEDPTTGELVISGEGLLIRMNKDKD
jgi:cell fate (sporulation/competence/biofilm development) regulator YmcA (YheA/YmcA/DUF963 family)